MYCDYICKDDSCKTYLSDCSDSSECCGTMNCVHPGHCANGKDCLDHGSSCSEELDQRFFACCGDMICVDGHCGYQSESQINLNQPEPRCATPKNNLSVYLVVAAFALGILSWLFSFFTPFSWNLVIIVVGLEAVSSMIAFILFLVSDEECKVKSSFPLYVISFIIGESLELIDICFEFRAKKEFKEYQENTMRTEATIKNEKKELLRSRILSLALPTLLSGIIPLILLGKSGWNVFSFRASELPLNIRNPTLTAYYIILPFTVALFACYIAIAFGAKVLENYTRMLIVFLLFSIPNSVGSIFIYIAVSRASGDDAAALAYLLTINTFQGIQVSDALSKFLFWWIKNNKEYLERIKKNHDNWEPAA